MQTLKRFTWVDAELVDQHRPYLLIGPQRLDPAARLVQCLDQPEPERLAGRLVGDEVAQLRDDRARIGGVKLEIDTPFDRHQSLFDQARNHLAIEPGGSYPEERLATPQSERRPQCREFRLR
jgi:hypothetical protein